MTSATHSTQRTRALAHFRAGKLVRLRDMVADGISAETVARLVREGAVVRQARGLYQSSDAPNDARHMLAAAAVLVPRAVICLVSALQFHDLTLQRPSEVWMAIDRSGWKPAVTYPPMRFVRFSPSRLTVGVERHRIEGASVTVFNAAKTVVDCFLYRNKIGLDVALEGLREGLRRRSFTIDQLITYARNARAWTVMRPYLEAIVADGR